MTVKPIKRVVDYEWDNSADGPITANDQIIGNDFSSIDGDMRTDSNEVVEVERIELIPPINDDGTVDTVEAIRLRDGSEFYPNLRYREFMMAADTPNLSLTTPRLGVPVLSGEADPGRNALATSCPKFGSDTPVEVAVVNDGTQIDQDFTVRLHTWRFKGSEQELSRYFQRENNLSTTIKQDISLSNPYKEVGQTYTSNPVRIQPGAEDEAYGQFTKLKGGNQQELPKVFPWVTWATNNNATRANKWYSFSSTDRNVDSDYKQLHFDYTSAKKAVTFDYLMAQEDVSNAQDLRIDMDSRRDEHQLTFSVEDNDKHQLPFLRRSDGTTPSADVDNVPTHVPDFYERQVLWNDGGGIQIRDDGNTLSTDAITLGVQGRYMELRS